MEGRVVHTAAMQWPLGQCQYRCHRCAASRKPPQQTYTSTSHPTCVCGAQKPPPLRSILLNRQPAAPPSVAGHPDDHSTQLARLERTALTAATTLGILPATLLTGHQGGAGSPGTCTAPHAAARAYPAPPCPLLFSTPKHRSSCTSLQACCATPTPWWPVVWPLPSLPKEACSRRLPQQLPLPLVRHPSHPLYLHLGLPGLHSYTPAPASKLPHPLPAASRHAVPRNHSTTPALQHKHSRMAVHIRAPMHDEDQPQGVPSLPISCRCCCWLEAYMRTHRHAQPCCWWLQTRPPGGWTTVAATQLHGVHADGGLGSPSQPGESLQSPWQPAQGGGDHSGHLCRCRAPQQAGIAGPGQQPHTCWLQCPGLPPAGAGALLSQPASCGARTPTLQPYERTRCSTGPSGGEPGGTC